FVYNFLKFVEWPDQALENAPLRLYVMGTSSTARAFEELEGKQVHGQRLSVETGKELSGCEQLQAVFLGADIVDQWMHQNRATLASCPVLTISDSSGFIAQGGMIELFKRGSKIRFKVNLRAARAAGLRISSRLLSLAREILK
ncbi:MAG: YfiR family protein, partial [Desulfovermiculus sp.]|nr:YfiR family protein [Desulfovermiculus sp.]